jgi:hypothetical protein
MASRFALFLRKLLIVSTTIAVVGIILAGVQAIFHPFDAWLADIDALIAGLDSRMTQEAFRGITIGSLALILALCVFPIFLSRIDEKAYARGLWRGVVSAAVFYLSSEVFSFASRVSRIHLIGAMFVVIVVGVVVVEGLSLAMREEEERSFRTDIVSSIASGFLFGVLVKLGGYGIEYLKLKL